MLKNLCYLGAFVLPSIFTNINPASAQTPTNQPVQEGQNQTIQPIFINYLIYDQPPIEKQLLNQQPEPEPQPNANDKPPTLNRLESRWRKFKYELEVLFGN